MNALKFPIILKAVKGSVVLPDLNFTITSSPVNMLKHFTYKEVARSKQLQVALLNNLVENVGELKFAPEEKEKISTWKGSKKKKQEKEVDEENF
jgi:hypothetical protein